MNKWSEVIKDTLDGYLKKCEAQNSRESLERMEILHRIITGRAVIHLPRDIEPDHVVVEK